MQSLIRRDDDEDNSASHLARQAVSFFLNTVLALGSWIALMLVGYYLSPANVSQLIILLLSLANSMSD